MLYMSMEMTCTSSKSTALVVLEIDTIIFSAQPDVQLERVAAKQPDPRDGIISPSGNDDVYVV